MPRCVNVVAKLGTQLLQLQTHFQRPASWRRWFIFTLLSFWTIVCLFPIYWVAIASIKDVPTLDGSPKYIPFLDFTPSLDAWRFIFFEHNENLVSRFFNSLIIGLSATLLTTLASCMLIYGLTRFHRRPKFNLISGILATRILPPAVLVIPLYVMASWLNILDSRLALSLVYVSINLPVAIWLIQPIMGTKATEQEEAAQLDGASHFSILTGILMPMIKSRLMAVSLVVFLLCWNEYLIAVYLTSDHALTLPPWMVGQLSLKEAQTGGGAEELAHLAAATIVMMLPALGLATFIQKIQPKSN